MSHLASFLGWLNVARKRLALAGSSAHGAWRRKYIGRKVAVYFLARISCIYLAYIGNGAHRGTYTMILLGQYILLAYLVRCHCWLGHVSVGGDCWFWYLTWEAVLLCIAN